MLSYFFVLIFSYVALVNCGSHFKRRQLPEYIKPCRVNAPDFSKCVIKHATLALPTLLKGDPKFKLAPLVPLDINRLELKPSDGLTLILENAKLYGFNTVEVIGAKADFKNRHINVNFTAKSLRLEADYNINGQILVLPIVGQGKATFRFDDGFMDYSLDYDLIKRADGYTYIDNIKPKMNFIINKAHYHLDNLFNGNQQLGESTNRALNENSQEVLGIFKEAMTQVLTVITSKVAKAYLTLVPYEEVFLPG